MDYKSDTTEKEKRYGDKAKEIDWTPSENNRQAFIDEYKRLKSDGGPSNSNNYNKRKSPGKKIFTTRKSIK
ncbi:MAG: hypothetical protein IJQ89_02550 [Bacteroidales bacterium]|nr:hypothetical protein [Bacteroidales bacterium]